MKKYVICPGKVISKSDGQVHYIGPMMLMQLYKVSPDECEIYEPAKWWPNSFYRMAEIKKLGLRILRPQHDGDYTL